MFDDGDALGRGGQRAEAEVNPMDGLINIADAFLVFTFVVLAMFISYLVNSVDSSIGIIDTGKELTTVSDTEDLAESIDGEGDFSKLGTVYIDNETGKMYVVQEGAAEGDGGDDGVAVADGDEAQE
jgi:hypothetical protein